MNRTIILIVMILLSLFGFGVWCRHQAGEQVRYALWGTKRREALQNVGMRILSDARRNNGVFAQTWDDLVGRGVIERGEIEFDDSEYGVRVKRSLRHAPTVTVSSDLGIILETYEPPAGSWIRVFTSGGRVFGYVGIEDFIDKDNALRRRLGIVEIPPP